MKHIKKLSDLNEYINAEYENYVEGGLEGVSAKDILLNVYPKTLEEIVKDFDKQCSTDSSFKNRNLSMLRSIISFCKKYNGTTSKYINSMEVKYNIK